MPISSYRGADWWVCPYLGNDYPDKCVSFFDLRDWNPGLPHWNNAYIQIGRCTHLA